MCMMGGGDKPPPVQMPKETQQMKEPDGGAVRSDQRRKTMDRMRSATQTMLTGGMGASSDDTSTAGKTLLGA